MKAIELQIGDYVDYRGQIIKVTSLYDKGGSNEVGWGIKEDTWVNAESIKPVPLTPENLARMGFTIEEVPKYDDTYTEDEYTATIKCVDTRKCEVKIEYKTYWKNLRAFNYDPHNRLGFTSIETQVEYVHELQHILRMLKVYKDLELEEGVSTKLRERSGNLTN